MNTTTPNNQPTDPEPETMRAFDSFFEMRDVRDHANQWHIAAIWSDEQMPKSTDVESR